MLDFVDLSKKPIDIFAGRRRRNQHRRVFEEENPRARLLD